MRKGKVRRGMKRGLKKKRSDGERKKTPEGTTKGRKENKMNNGPRRTKNLNGL